MGYSEYSTQLHEYQRAMSTKKSLEMTIRQNEVWLKGYTAKSQSKRVIVIEKAKSRLAMLVIPVKPVKEYGFDVITPDDVFFAPTTDLDQAHSWAYTELDDYDSIKLSKRQITTDYQGLVY